MLAINIVIGDRSYRIKVEPQNEEPVRKAVKVINDKITEFRTSFAGKDMQDYVAMVLVWYATQTSSGNENIDSSQLEDLENLLDSALKS